MLFMPYSASSPTALSAKSPAILPAKSPEKSLAILPRPYFAKFPIPIFEKPNPFFSFSLLLFWWLAKMLSSFSYLFSISSLSFT